MSAAAARPRCSIDEMLVSARQGLARLDPAKR
jgi:hypothetical protein